MKEKRVGKGYMSLHSIFLFKKQAGHQGAVLSAWISWGTKAQAQQPLLCFYDNNKLIAHLQFNHCFRFKPTLMTCTVVSIYSFWLSNEGCFFYPKLFVTFTPGSHCGLKLFMKTTIWSKSLYRINKRQFNEGLLQAGFNQNITLSWTKIKCNTCCNYNILF